MPNQNIGLRIDADLLDQVDALAERLGQTRTAIITEAIHQRLGLPVGGSVEQRLTDVEQRLNAVEQALGDRAQQRLTLPNKTAAPSPIVPTAPAAKQPRQNRQQGDGLSIGAALIAAGADISERQAMGGNRDKRMVPRYGVKSREWLLAQGWAKDGLMWYPPQSKTPAD